MKPKLLDNKTLTQITDQVRSSRTVRRLVKKKLQNMSDRKRYITILADVQLINMDGTPARDPTDGSPATLSHVKFIRSRLTDNAFVSDTPLKGETVHWTMSMAVAQETIIAKLALINGPGDVLVLDEDDWMLLKRSTEIGTTYNPSGMRSALPFMRSITTAATEDPRKAKKELEKSTES